MLVYFISFEIAAPLIIPEISEPCDSHVTHNEDNSEPESDKVSPLIHSLLSLTLPDSSELMEWILHLNLLLCAAYYALIHAALTVNVNCKSLRLHDCNDFISISL